MDKDARLAARQAVAEAVRKGLIPRQPCADCGEPKTDAHHHLGYDPGHWLDVVWLCRADHAKAHFAARADMTRRHHRWADIRGARADIGPREAMTLAELRLVSEVRQEELASRLGMTQSNISRLERRRDLQLSSLRRYVEALGATLSVRVRFPDGDVSELTPDR